LLQDKQYRKAEVAAREGLEAARSIGDKILVPRSLAQLGIMEESEGNHRTADRFFREAGEIVEAILATTTSPNATSFDSEFHGVGFHWAFRAGRNAT
jgi:hypothetical protein